MSKESSPRRSAAPASSGRHPQEREHPIPRLAARIVHEARVEAEGDVVQEEASPTSRCRCAAPRPENAWRAPIGSSRSRPASRAKWLRVPKGMQTKGLVARGRRRRSAASEPSPPAMPSARATDRPPRVAVVVLTRDAHVAPPRRGPRGLDELSAPDGSSPDRGLTTRKGFRQRPRWRAASRPGPTRTRWPSGSAGRRPRCRSASSSPSRSRSPAGLEALDLALDLVRGELEADRAAHFTAAVGIPREDEEGLLLEDEEGAERVLALVVRRRGPVAEQPRVEVDRPVEVGDVEVDGRDDARSATSPSAGARRAWHVPSSCAGGRSATA